jgi:HK97 family phage prohead protease
MTIIATALDEFTATEIQFRAATIDALNTDERVVEMRAVPYEVETRLAPGIVEVFSRGAFARAAKDPARCKLWHDHSVSGGRIVGQAFEVEDRADGLWVRARVSRTPSGDELLTLAGDKVLDEASIEFNPLREGMAISRRGDDTVVRHKRAHLRGVALVPHGQYGRDALVSSVRDAASDKARDEWLARLRARTA